MKARLFEYVKHGTAPPYDEIRVGPSGDSLTVSKNGVSYTYPTNGVRPHAVSSVGSTSYLYDNNGNMTTRGSQTITWDVENRPLTVTGGASFVYDGDGNRANKTEGGQTILYVNKYYEKNLTTGEVTTYYYHGDKLVAKRTATTVQHIHQDHLTGSSVVSTSNGALVNTILYAPYGSTRSGDVPTDRKFTGQRLDGTGLYYYNARYYDPTIGRFISADTIVPNPTNPQALNRYSYVVNNPLKYTDPSGRVFTIEYDADPNSFWDMWTLASLHGQLEDKYREMIGDPNMSAEDRGALQTLHDSPGITLQFDRYGAELDKMLAGVSDLARRLPAGEPERGAKWGRTVYYDWNPQSTYWFGHGRRGDWARDYATGHKPIQMDWGGLGKTIGGSALIAAGSMVGGAGGGTLIVSFATGAWPASFPAASVTMTGYDIINAGVKTASGGKNSLPSLDPYTKYLLFRQTAIYNLFKYVFGQ